MKIQYGSMKIIISEIAVFKNLFSIYKNLRVFVEKFNSFYGMGVKLLELLEFFVLVKCMGFILL